ncbi:AAA family ATPase [Myxococcus sp. CA051A]|uniref:AAA family ATPase n=1 Tax=Myxococcus sp. CA051A TaxID=2741739 RepID=UPI00157B4BAF|nr:AAA family ATPase [Myxococcus sp. CA051A]NTX65954.1 AAA family ATPase [Myxococcus sp. CA051A]
MWRRIEIRNFRSIEYADITLAPFTAVVGPNASGKSNIADAFVFARDVAWDASSAVQNRGGIVSVRRWRPSKPVDVSIDVRVSPTEIGLELDYARHAFTLGSKREGEWEFKRETIEEYRGGDPIFSISRERDKSSSRDSVSGKATERQLPPIAKTTSVMVLGRQMNMRSRLMPALRNVRRFRLDPQSMREPQLSTERVRLDESGSNIAMAIKSLRRQRLDWEAVLLAMQRIVPGLRDIQEGALGRYLSIRFFQQQREEEWAEFAATEMSEGAIRALGILVAAQQMARDELLVIEEPEVSVHPGAAAVLFDVLARSSKRGAVLLTTHSPELLDAAKDEEILVCDYRKGVTHVGPLEESQRKLVRDGLMSAAELMRSEPLRIEGMAPPVITPGEAE